MMVWVGDEAKEVGIASPFKDADTKIAGKTKNSGGFLQNNLMYLIIGSLLVIIAVLFFTMKKKQS